MLDRAIKNFQHGCEHTALSCLFYALDNEYSVSGNYRSTIWESLSELSEYLNTLAADLAVTAHYLALKRPLQQHELTRLEAIGQLQVAVKSISDDCRIGSQGTPRTTASGPLLFENLATVRKALDRAVVLTPELEPRAAVVRDDIRAFASRFETCIEVDREEGNSFSRSYGSGLALTDAEFSYYKGLVFAALMRLIGCACYQALTGGSLLTREDRALLASIDFANEIESRKWQCSVPQDEEENECLW